MAFQKLIRDKIPQIIEQKGEVCRFHIAEDKEYDEALQKKLYEEVSEFLVNPSVEEAADILEVLMSICQWKQVDIQNLEAVRSKKAEERGSFEKRIIWEKSE